MSIAGHVRSIYRYPIKSMAGESLTSAQVGWHGLQGDRRLAFVRSGARNAMPWLTAGKVPSMVTYAPVWDGDGELPSKVRTPSGEELELWSDELRAELTAAHGAPVELLHFGNGIFDDAPISIITTSAIAVVTAAAGVDDDPRRFRPNLLIETPDGPGFVEDGWVGRTVRIGDSDDGAMVAICNRDVRCGMLNLHPDTGVADPRLMKAAVRLNENCTGVYATVVRTGVVRVGDPIHLD
jgi:uncharacterized protein YcbX